MYIFLLFTRVERDLVVVGALIVPPSVFEVILLQFGVWASENDILLLVLLRLLAAIVTLGLLCFA